MESPAHRRLQAIHSHLLPSINDDYSHFQIHSNLTAGHNFALGTFILSIFVSACVCVYITYMIYICCIYRCTYRFWFSIITNLKL